MKVKGPIIGLASSLFCAASAFLLDKAGISVFIISSTSNHSFSAMYYLFVIASCLTMYHVVLILTTLRIHLRQGTYNEVKMLKGFYKSLTGLAILIGLFYVLGMLSAFGSFFSLFGGMLLGWSLQAPVSGFAAWVMITVMRPYKIGDRVQFPNYALMGDVVKFSPMYLTLNQVGGTIGSEEPIGRMINVPNALLFGAMVINCTYMQKKEEAAYVLDEAVFRITLDSDWDAVEQILIDTARIVTREIIEITKIDPYVRADTWEYGTLFRLRYMTNSTDRPLIMYEIVKRATKEIQTNKNVDLAIPFVYSFKRGVDRTGSGGKFNEDVEQIDISKIACDKLLDETFWTENKDEIIRLVKSINDEGMLQPIMVSRNMFDENYTLCFGEKRLKACQILGWNKIPAIIKNKIGTDIIRSKQLGTDATII